MPSRTEKGRQQNRRNPTQNSMIRSQILREIQLPTNSSPTNHLLGLTQTPENLEQEADGHKIDEKLDQIKTNRDQTFHRPSQGSW